MDDNDLFDDHADHSHLRDESEWNSSREEEDRRPVDPRRARIIKWAFVAFSAWAVCGVVLGFGNYISKFSQGGIKTPFKTIAPAKVAQSTPKNSNRARNRSKTGPNANKSSEDESTCTR